MFQRLKGFVVRPTVRRRLIVGGLVVVGLWIAFFDSHSLLKRLQYVQEKRSLAAEVENLRQTNEVLEENIRHGLTDELVEKVAREQYGMRRAGETVYPVEE